MIKAIKAEKIDKILILGTSDEMVERIAENLKLPKIKNKTFIVFVKTSVRLHA